MNTTVQQQERLLNLKKGISEVNTKIYNLEIEARMLAIDLELEKQLQTLKKY
jgi:hypothetical protein